MKQSNLSHIAQFWKKRMKNVSKTLSVSNKLAHDSLSEGAYYSHLLLRGSNKPLEETGKKTGKIL